MKIQYSEWNDGINLKKDRINIIEFDNGAAFYLFCQRILNFETIEDYFYISDGISKQCKIQSILEVIINLFQIDFNDKKILTSFYKKIVKE
jgi:CRISPR type II-A-associated protein Csn2